MKTLKEFLEGYITEIGSYTKHSPADIKKRDALMKGQQKAHDNNKSWEKKEKNPYLKGFHDPFYYASRKDK